MIKIATTVWLLACSAIAFSQTTFTIKGKVADENGQAIPYANVYIEGSLDGTSTTDDGRFSLSTNNGGTITLVVSFIGYKPFSLKGESREMTDLNIRLLPNTKNLEEVVVIAGNYQLKNASTLNSKKAVDLVSTAGSNGDLFKAISMLPGTQVANRDGRLLVRGGSNKETQTYIDDMHVLSPYTGAFGEVGSRSRYSPFLFDGINFSLGGYVPEYSQGLSAVLPLYTRDEVTKSKMGIDIMNVSLGSSGSIPFHKGSNSYNVNYTDMGLYNELFFPSLKSRWEKPYRQIGLQNQFRFTLDKNTFLKTYLGFSKTGFVLNTKNPFENQSRKLNFDEDNFYLNSTLQKKFGNGIRFFAGAAYSFNHQNIKNAQTINDLYSTKESEIHLKTKAEKRFSNFYKLSGGSELFLKDYRFNYTDSTAFETDFEHKIGGVFVSNDFNPVKNLFINLSSRIEYTSLSDKWLLLPRAAVGYKWKDFTVSGVIGKYQQNTDNEILIYNKTLLPENNVQALVGLYYEKESKIIRIEAYHKKYNHLPLKTSDSFPFYNSAGNGYSKGFDVFINDTRFLKHWEYMIAYSYNDSQREYLDFPEIAEPSFAMRHNASIALKYSNFSIRSIISISNRFASGRAYHNPNINGFMNAKTPNYNSLDASWIYLASKRIIIYTGFSNILNRTNVFGYSFNDKKNAENSYDSSPLTQQINQGFYFGCFISLGKNAAYNTSNFY